jgi:signal transduction histidine kinase
VKLINHTLLFLAAILFVSAGIWAVLFYFQVLKQVKATVDDGLSDNKILIIDNLKDDSLIVQKDEFLENNYIIRQVSEDYAIQVRDTYKDTLVFSPLKGYNYQTRLLTTAFLAADGKYYEMKVISHELDKGTLIKRIITSLFFFYLLLFLSTLLVNHFALRNTWKPFYRLLNYLDEFRLDQKKLPDLSTTRISEFNLLNESVLKLLKTNVDIYSSQKQFIENASHELQTPLAIGINKLELLAGDEDLSQDQLRKIGEIIEAFRRLSGLNRSLLLLSRIENKQFITSEPVDFDDLISRVLGDFSDYSEYKDLNIKYRKNDPWKFTMNKDLAEILVMNLVKNAIVHNHPEGDVSIILNSTGFVIENSSEGNSLERDQLFQRFSNKQSSKSSTGLGLAIVKAITEESGLEIRYSYDGNHAFTVGSVK